MYQYHVKLRNIFTSSEIWDPNVTQVPVDRKTVCETVLLELVKYWLISTDFPTFPLSVIGYITGITAKTLSPMIALMLLCQAGLDAQMNVVAYL